MPSGQAGREAIVEHLGTKHLQPADGPVEQSPNDRIGRRILGEPVEVALQDGSSATFVRRRRPTAQIRYGLRS